MGYKIVLKLRSKKIDKPFPMCLLVFSMVEFLFTFDCNPRQNLSALLLGSVYPSTMTEFVCA